VTEAMEQLPELGGNPVLDLLGRRRESEAVDDGARIALVIEGGGMRGVVCGGMVAALESLGLTRAFDEVVGCSAGAVAGAFFVAGQAAFGTRIFYEEINNNQFIDKRRLLLGRPVVSVDFLLDDVCMNAKRLDWEAVRNARTRLVCVTSDLDDQDTATIDSFANRDDLFSALRGSARIPGVAGPPVLIDGHRHVDGGVFQNIPLQAAQQRGATHAVVLKTRPTGAIPKTSDLAEKLLMIPWLNRQQRGVGDSYRRQPERYRAEIEHVLAEAAMPAPKVISVAAARESTEISNIEKDRAKLMTGAKDGFDAVYRAFGLVPPPPVASLCLD
jgi:predicted patatin/cPLA2 family phospholipase